MMSSASAGEGSQSQSQSQSQPFNHDLPNPGHPLHLSQICLLRSRLVRPPSLPRAFPTPSASNLCSHPPLSSPGTIQRLSPPQSTCITISSASHLACSISPLPWICLPRFGSFRASHRPSAPVTPPHAAQAPVCSPLPHFLFYSSSSPTPNVARSDAVVSLCPRARRGHAYHGTHSPFCSSLRLV